MTLGHLFAENTTGFDFTVYGVAGTTIAILLYILSIVWKDNRELRHQADERAARSLETVTAVATTSSIQLAESAKAMEAATVMMHTLAGRPGLSPERLFELNSLLRELRDLQREVREILRSRS